MLLTGTFFLVVVIVMIVDVLAVFSTSLQHSRVIQLRLGLRSLSGVISLRRGGQSHLEEGMHAQTAQSASDRDGQVLLPGREAAE